MKASEIKLNGCLSADQKKRLKKCEGRLQDYAPYLRQADTKTSHGQKVITAPDPKTHRSHLLLSQLEEKVFILLINNPLVVDVREQYPVGTPLEMAKIAKSKGYKPVHAPGEKCGEHVMTTDFNVTVEKDGKRRDVIVTVKYSKDIDPNNEQNTRTLEKLDMERTWFVEEKGMDWMIVTEKDVDDELVAKYERKRILERNQNHVRS